MTTNESIDDILQQLAKAKGKDVNIKINYLIAASVDFLDVTITNEGGILRTSVFHKTAAEPYILPFTSDHPRHIHRNIPYAALLRAARLCSDVEDFNAECVRMDVYLLLNDYSPDFISRQKQRFFQTNHAMSLLNQLDRNTYQALHRKTLHRLTRREKETAEATLDPIASPAVLQDKIWNSSVMYPKYLFDRAFTVHLHDRFHKWWNHFYRYPGSPVRLVHVYLTSTTNKTLEQFLIKKKPSKRMLKGDVTNH